MSIKIDKNELTWSPINGSYEELRRTLRGSICPTDIFRDLFPLKDTDTLVKGEIVVVEKSKKMFYFAGVISGNKNSKEFPISLSVSNLKAMNVPFKNVYKIPETVLGRLSRESASHIYTNENGVLRYSVLNRRTPSISCYDTINFNFETKKIESIMPKVEFFPNNEIVKTAAILNQKAFRYDPHSKTFPWREVDSQDVENGDIFLEFVDHYRWMIPQQSARGSGSAVVEMMKSDKKSRLAISFDNLKHMQLESRSSIKSALIEAGLNAVQHTPRSLEHALTCLAEHGSAIVSIDDHYVMLDGIDLKNNHFQIRDPYHGMAMTVTYKKEFLENWIQVEKSYCVF